MRAVDIPSLASETTQGTSTLHFRGSQSQWPVCPTSVTTFLGILDLPLFLLNRGICPAWKLCSGPGLLGGLDTLGGKVPAPEGSRSLGLGLGAAGADSIMVCVLSTDFILGPGDPASETPELNFK